ALLIGVIGAVCGYGIKQGLLVSAEWISIISDGLVIVYIRNLIFKKRCIGDFLRRQKTYLPTLIITSVVLHPITYYFLGVKSFTLVVPMLALLVMIYLIQKYLNWRNTHRNE